MTRETYKENLPPPSLEYLPHVLNSGDHSDMTIRCPTKDWKVHKAIVCSVSPMLKTAMASSFIEAHSAMYTLGRFESIHVGVMLDFVYTGEYLTGGGWSYGDMNFHQDKWRVRANMAKDWDIITDGIENIAGSTGNPPPPSREPTPGDDQTASAPVSTITPVASWCEDVTSKYKCLVFNIQMNALGDYLQIEPLMGASRLRIEEHIRQWINSDKDWEVDEDDKRPGKAKPEEPTPAGSSSLVGVSKLIHYAYATTGDNELFELLAEKLAMCIYKMYKKNDDKRIKKSLLLERFAGIPGFSAKLMHHMYKRMETQCCTHGRKRKR
jgi:hypothetical protein